ncbi:protein of unknown function [Chryseobacterium sp. JV274]|nr:protein of unknown function [Chryseobacterium sp. JV274]
MNLKLKHKLQKYKSQTSVNLQKGIFCDIFHKFTELYQSDDSIKCF